MRLPDYAGAAQAYDEAFRLYSLLPEKGRPWRMMWYQTGPYWAYYYTGRYQDVIDLATTTLGAMSQPVLEESYYWRALARLALSDSKGAVKDLRLSLEYHPGFEPAGTVRTGRRRAFARQIPPRRRVLHRSQRQVTPR